MAEHVVHGAKPIDRRVGQHGVGGGDGAGQGGGSAASAW
jgi:hypothetical protein